jgi:hypothetical protein
MILQDNCGLLNLANAQKQLRPVIGTLPKIRLKRGYLDKGFCSIPVMRGLLAEPDLSIIMAAPIKGKTGGTRALCQGRRRYLTEHTFRSTEHGELTVPVMVVRTRAYTWVWLVYVLLHVLDLTPRQVRKAYRRRFGIESSYRLLEQVRGKTTAQCSLAFFVDGDRAVDRQYLDRVALEISPTPGFRPPAGRSKSIHSAVYAPIFAAGD